MSSYETLLKLSAHVVKHSGAVLLLTLAESASTVTCSASLCTKGISAFKDSNPGRPTPNI
jgi:hypothetical protein